MRTLQKWYLSRRNGTNGIFYVEFKDKDTGKKLTAKSTGTRNRKEAEAIASEWYYNPTSDFNTRQKEREKESLKRYLQSSLLSEQEIHSIFHETFNSLFINAAQKHSPEKEHRKKRCSKYPEIQAIQENSESLTFKDYLFLFSDYERSPYIKQLKRTGEKLPHSVENGYVLKIDKNYNFSMNLLKGTKTNRKDLVPISDTMAQELLRFLQTNPYKDSDAYIFYSAMKERPLSYKSVYDNFNTTMEQ